MIFALPFALEEDDDDDRLLPLMRYCRLVASAMLEEEEARIASGAARLEPFRWMTYMRNGARFSLRESARCDPPPLPGYRQADGSQPARRRD